MHPVEKDAAHGIHNCPVCAIRAAAAEAKARVTPVATCRDCGAEWKAVRRGECSRCGSDNTPIPPASPGAERDRAAEVEAAEDRAEQVAFDSWRERSL